MKLKKPNFSAAAVCERAKARRAVLASVIDGPGPDGWKLEQVRLFIEEADGDETLDQVAERETYIWDGPSLTTKSTGEIYGGIYQNDNQFGGYVAFELHSYGEVCIGRREECMLALEKRFREAQ